MTWSEQVQFHAPYLAIILVLLTIVAVLVSLIFKLLKPLFIQQTLNNVERLRNLSEWDDERRS